MAAGSELLEVVADSYGTPGGSGGSLCGAAPTRRGCRRELVPRQSGAAPRWPTRARRSDTAGPAGGAGRRAPVSTYGQAPIPAPTPPGVQAGMAAAAAGAGAAPGAWRQIFGVFVDPGCYKALLYMILSLATGITYFTLVVTGVSTAGGMLVLIVGIPLFLLVLGMVRAMALFEGRLVEGLLGTRMPRRERAEPTEHGLA